MKEVNPKNEMKGQELYKYCLMRMFFCLFISLEFFVPLEFFKILLADVIIAGKVLQI